MAVLHPELENLTLTHGGSYREQDILRRLELALPGSFDIYHSVIFSTATRDRQFYGEIDVAILTPGGHLICLEVKAGAVNVSDGDITKAYRGESRSISNQLGGQRAGWLKLLRQNRFAGVSFQHFLILPDQVVEAGSAAFPRERIVDAKQMDEIGSILREAVPVNFLSDGERERLARFLENRFELTPDPAVRIGQVARANKVLAEGLATWVPRIRNPGGVYQIEGTAGSGKTQLALTLLRTAANDGLKAAYVCYNRPLADHIAKISPAAAIVSNFDDLAIAHFRKVNESVDFDDPQVFETAASAFLRHLEATPPVYDLMVIDEAQDFKTEWIFGLSTAMKEGGQLYTLSDQSQLIYQREPFEISDSITIECDENFRSPKKIVDTINALGLTDRAVRSRSVHAGEPPELVVHNAASADKTLDRCVKHLIDSGYEASQITLLSYRGRKNSELLKRQSVAGLKTSCFTGAYDDAGNPIYSPGELFCETVYRFKGQSSAVVVFCEIDFDELNQQERRKLFVGMSRAQHHLVCLFSERAEKALAEKLTAQ